MAKTFLKNKKCLNCYKEFSIKKGTTIKQWNKSFWCSRYCFNTKNKGIPLSDDHKRKIKQSLIGRVLSQEWKDKISKGNKGKIRTEEFKNRLRNYQIGHTPWNKGKIGITTPWNKGKKCPQFSGKNHPNWIKDRTENIERHRIRSSKEYSDWRTKVFERDDYTCQICGSRGYKLQADHIKPFAYFPELRLVIDNGRTLCVSCHRKTDTYGMKVKQLINKKKKQCLKHFSLLA